MKYFVVLLAACVATCHAGVYTDRFMTQYNKMHNASNGYFSSQGIPYHSVETLICEAPDYGHQTTSEAYSFYVWLEAVYGAINGDFSTFNSAWENLEQYIIPKHNIQITQGYNPSHPATYAAELDDPSNYPSPIDSGVPVGQDPIYQELVNAYGTEDMYGMHWLLDVDNKYGFGDSPDTCEGGPSVSGSSYINTFQRGPMESVWRTIPQPTCDSFKYGGQNGFLDLFIKDNSYAQQWKYTNAPDADARAIQAAYWAGQWANAAGQLSSVSETLGKAAKMGDYLRYAMFDKYFKQIGNCVDPYSCPGASGKNSAHYLMSWYYAWGGAQYGGWSWRISDGTAHFGYQNPLTAWALSNDANLKPKGATAVEDWKNSLERQLEFYEYLQSNEGAFAGGATNSWKGRYATPDSNVTGSNSLFHGMFYDWEPVYHDPPSNRWFGMQPWSVDRLAQYYYVTGDATAKTLLDKWVKWVVANIKFDNNDFQVPDQLSWSGVPPSVSCTVTKYSQDVGSGSALARALSYYAAKSGDTSVKETAKKLLDAIWTHQTDKGVAVVETREDYSQFNEPVYVPQGWTGSYPDGTQISNGATFISLRPWYKQDPDWSKVEAYLNGGAVPTFTYHRFWSQSEVAIAQGVYGLLFNESKLFCDNWTHKGSKMKFFAILLAACVATCNAGVYTDRFLTQYNKLHNASNGYFSSQGVPYHSVETLCVEAPDYGHQTTSEAYSFYIWLEAVYGAIKGDFSTFNSAWENLEEYIIPKHNIQITQGYNPSHPATYAPELDDPSNYPAQIDSGVPVGQDPIYQELVNAYGTEDIYGMHWLLDVDNKYGFGDSPDTCEGGPYVSGSSYINSFQRGSMESVWRTIPQPTCDSYKYGGPNGFLDLFVKDNSYAPQWKYTNAPDADARAVQAAYWAGQWANAIGQLSSVSGTLSKASKMGDYLRYSLFDKYFKQIGNCVDPYSCPGASGKNSAHYLMSWYYAWGGAQNGGWSWRIGDSTSHFGYQNPLAAWALANDANLKPKGATAVEDWKNSLERQLEFYQYLQSNEGAFAGGATNSWKGRYATPDSNVTGSNSLFHGMFYDWEPVYHDPPSNRWFGMQPWSVDRLAQYYYVTGDSTAKTLLDKWVKWAVASIKLENNDFQVPDQLAWSGVPPSVSCSITTYSQDVGSASALARALSYYAAKSGDTSVKETAKKLLDAIWTHQTDKGVAVVETRSDYSQFNEPVYVPQGWTGSYPDGTQIQNGATFISLRPWYKQDPEWSKVESYLNGGAAPTFTYHRFWSQSEVAIAQGIYGMLFNE